jgi:hypothetical protein
MFDIKPIDEQQALMVKSFQDFWLQWLTMIWNPFSYIPTPSI